ncbi:hypothetical protein ITJ86_13205 [Winogradskyella sp. F6397]|uniref:Uncharacterized protein n=1 Tax=Winogradskyella marina TaxID=2785530 RepID=A0ABS0EKC4_9FLAO|nr:hypothetical protein [Winogradskyella marina]MBF8150864.1 hypothetical protein [Winogradskyella marina]
MKTKITLLILFLTTLGFAQNGINYKAVIKDNIGNVVANDLVVVQFSILQGAAQTNVFTETHSPSTDENGIITVNIGEGTPVSGTFASIDWASEDHYLNVQINVGDGLTDMGTTQFKTVPYAIASGDKSWEVETDNVHVLTKNVGIGTTAPTDLLHIYDDETSGINLSVPNFSDVSQIEFKNGSETGFHSFYKILNREDALRFELDTDLSATGEGYESKMTLSNSGLELENGTRINEFSTDGTLAGNSNNAIPTEAAVKAYVDNRGQSNYWKIDNLNTNNITATSTYQPIGPVLIINKEFSDSNIEVTLNSRVNGGVFSSPSVNGINFKIRIDGIETTLDNIGSIIDSNTIDFLSIFAVFEGLSVGSHTIQVYASTSPFGTSSNVGLDPGGWNGAIIAKETF